MKSGAGDPPETYPASGFAQRATRATPAGMECRPGAMYHPPKLLRRVPEVPSSATIPKALQPTVRCCSLNSPRLRHHEMQRTSDSGH